MSKILVVEDSRTQALQIQLLLEDAGYTVSLAGQGREALSVLERGLPDVVLTDLDMPEMNGLELVEAVREDYPGVPVMLMTALGSEEIAVQALQKGAASYVSKWRLTQELIPSLHNVLAVAQAGQFRERLLDSLTHAEFHFVLDNDTSLVPPLIGHLGENAARIQHCDRTEAMRVGALHEALLNAIQHGNLEVSSELRQEDDEKAFRELTTSRRRQPPYQNRRVHVRTTLSPAESVYVIADEGPGFDPTRLPDPTDPANLERIGGRGLTLIRTFMDHVAYNVRGNEITLVKHHRTRPREQPARVG